ncbi:heme exporter protein CcmB [Rhizobiaceae bacterium]|nr:heme exporter protein CcmB [Rhizobiaceae bacterium]
MMAVLARDFRLALGAGGATVLLFYFAVVVAVPFAVGPDPKLLAAIGPAVLWIGALLASLLGLERMFAADHEDGTLDQLMLAPVPLELVCLAKALAHWLATGLPVALVTPLFGLMLGLDATTIAATVATLLVGTPAVSFIGTVGAAVTVGLARGGLLLAVLVLPLTIPTVIFAVAAARGAVAEPDPFLAPLALTAALSAFFAVLGPLAAAFALRHRDG